MTPCINNKKKNTLASPIRKFRAVSNLLRLATSSYSSPPLQTHRHSLSPMDSVPSWVALIDWLGLQDIAFEMACKARESKGRLTRDIEEPSAP